MWIQDSKGTLFNLLLAERVYIEAQALVAVFSGVAQVIHRFDSDKAAQTVLDAIASQLHIIQPLNLD